MKKIFGLLLFFTLLMGQAAMAQQDIDIAEVLSKAQAGDAVSQYYLGMSYEYGVGVTQSYTEAVKWYRKAAEQGFDEAQYLLESAMNWARA